MPETLICIALIAAPALIGLLLLKPRGPALMFGASALFMIVPLGFMVIGAAAAVAWKLGMPPETSAPLWGALLMAIAAGAFLWDRPTTWFAADAEEPLTPLSKLLSLFLAAIFLAPPLYATAWMGSGAAPPVFFNVDLPYYLSQVHALARSDVYPPESLNTHGVVLPYHYGVQLTASLFTRFAGVPAHVAFFWIVIPAFLFGVAGLAWRLASLAARHGMPHSLALLVLLFFGVATFGALASGLQEWLVEGGDFFGRLDLAFAGSGMPSAGTLTGAFAAFAAGLLLVDDTLRFRLAALALIVGALPLFKSTAIVPIGLWFGIWAIYVLAADRRIAPLAAAGGALVLAAWLSSDVQRASHTFEFALDFWRHGDAWSEDIGRATTRYGLAILFVCACVLLSRQATQAAPPAASASALIGSAVVLYLPVFIYVTYLTIDDQRVPLTETRQWLTPLTIMLSVALVGVLGSRWRALGRPQRFALSVALLAVTLPSAVGKLTDTLTLTMTPERWHDFADNSKIAPALAVVPVGGSIVATNDLFYPADNYARDRRQFQIAALFGHQAYGAAVLYDRPSNPKERTAAQESLATDDPIEQLIGTACEQGWTHVLFSKRVAHPKAWPGVLLFENDAYLTFRFERSAMCGTS